VSRLSLSLECLVPCSTSCPVSDVYRVPVRLQHFTALGTYYWGLYVYLHICLERSRFLLCHGDIISVDVGVTMHAVIR